VTPLQTYYYTEDLVVLRIENETSGTLARKYGHYTAEAVPSLRRYGGKL
jgi:hypothetical protein